MIHRVDDRGQVFHQLMDKILQYFAGDSFAAEIRLAKSQFFDDAGILDERDASFELRMSQFFDWYFFTRELSGFGTTPLETVHMIRDLRFSSEELDLIERMKHHRHSLFEFRKLRDSDVHLLDLLRNEKIVVQKSPWIYGFDSSEIFEARLIPSDGSLLFTRGFCFHPVDASKFILGEVKRHRKDPDLDPDEMILRLIKMRYKFDRYRHVKIDRIYCAEKATGV